MKYSNTTLRELSARYRLILKKCAFLNATLLLGATILSSTSAQALTTHIRYWETENYILRTVRDDLWNEGTVNLSNTLILETGVRGTGKINTSNSATIEGYRRAATFTGNTINMNASSDLTLNQIQLSNASINLAGKNDLEIRNNSVIAFSDPLKIDARSTLYLDSTSSMNNNIQNLGSIINEGVITSAIDSNTGMITNTGTLNLTGSDNDTPLEQANTILGTGTTNFSGNSKNIGIITQGKVVNSGSLTNANTITAQVTNNANATLTNTGSITDIINNGTLNNTGNITSSLTNNNIAENTGTISAPVINSGSFTSSGLISNQVTNNANSNFLNSGIIDGVILNSGVFDNSGQLKKAVTNQSGATFTSNGDKFESTVTNEENGVLDFTGGTFSTTLSGEGTTNITGATINTSSSFHQKNLAIEEEFTNNGAVDVENLKLDSNILGTGSLTLTGDHDFSSSTGSITQGQLSLSQSTIANVGQMTANILNTGKMTLLGGSDEALTQTNTITGETGNLIFKGMVKNKGNISQLILTNEGDFDNEGVLTTDIRNISGASFKTNADKLLGITQNNGAFELTGGTLISDASINGMGDLTISGDMTNQAEITQNTITNSAILTNEGLLSGSILNNEKAKIISSADNINGPLENNGDLELTSGQWTQELTGAGSTLISGDVTNNSSSFNQAYLDVSSVLTNNGIIETKTLDLNADIIGDGTLNLTDKNDISASENTITQNVVNLTGDLTANVEQISANIDNEADLILKGGEDDFLTQSNEIRGKTGSITLTDFVINDALIQQENIKNIGFLQNNALLEGKIENTQDGFMESSADYLNGEILNNGSITVVGGTLASTSPITGTGDILFDEESINNATITQTKIDNIGNLTNNGVLTGAISNSEEATLSSSASGLVGEIENNGVLNLTNGTLISSSPIKGVGSVFTNGNIINQADITQALLTNNGALQNEGVLNTALVNQQGALLSSSADKILGNVENNGTLDLRGGLFTQSLTGTGTTAISQNTTIETGVFSQNHLDINAETINNSTITTNTLNLANNISGNGSLILTGDNNFMGSGYTINQSSLQNTGRLSASVGQILAPVQNTGTFNLTGISGIAQNHDILNNGDMTISGDLLLHANIIGSGSIAFNEGASLTSVFNQYVVSANSVTNNGSTPVNLTLENMNILEEGSYNFINSNNGIDTTKFNLTNTNPVYDLILTENGQIKATLKPEPVLQETTAIPEPDKVHELEAILLAEHKSTPLGNIIAKSLSETLQQNQKDVAVKAAKDLAPTPVQEVVVMAQNVNTLLTNTALTRMANVGRAGGDSGRSGGDMFQDGSTWVQGLYNHTRQNDDASTDGFRANSHGIAMGIDGKINENTTLGIGYGYLKTKADSGSHDYNINSHNFFVYGEYQPNRWYIDAILNYGYAKYKEKKSPLGITIKDKYDVNTYSANMMTGYDFDNGFTPEAGLRYVYADQESYMDGIQRVSSDQNDVLTTVAGLKYGRYMKSRSLIFKPKLRLAATYDLLSDNSNANVNVMGGGNYLVGTKRLHRFGIETGAGIETVFGNWNLSLDYSGGFRKDFRTHTGRIKAKYNF